MEKKITRKNGDTFTVRPLTPYRVAEAGRILARCKIGLRLNDPSLEAAPYMPVAQALAVLTNYTTRSGESILASAQDERQKLDILADIPGVVDEIVTSADAFSKEIAENRGADAGN